VLLNVTSRTYSSLLDTLMREWAKKQGKERWGDKSPGYITKLSLLHKLYPNAKVVHIIRDGRDVWLSLKNLGWEKNVVKVARVWAAVIHSARQYAHKNIETNYIELRYENLLSHPQEELEKIMLFLDEPYTDELLRAEMASRRNKAFLRWPRVNKGIESTNRNKWEKELSLQESALFESQAGYMLKNSGYPLVHDRPSNGLRLKLVGLIMASYMERSYGLVKRCSTLFEEQLRSLSRTR